MEDFRETVYCIPTWGWLGYNRYGRILLLSAFGAIESGCGFVDELPQIELARLSLGRAQAGS